MGKKSKRNKGGTKKGATKPQAPWELAEQARERRSRQRPIHDEAPEELQEGRRILYYALQEDCPEKNIGICKEIEQVGEQTFIKALALLRTRTVKTCMLKYQLFLFE